MKYKLLKNMSVEYIEALIDIVTLKKRFALVACMCRSRSSRHKNCRIGGLMFDGLIQRQIAQDLANEISDPFKHLSLEIKDSTSRQV